MLNISRILSYRILSIGRVSDKTPAKSFFPNVSNHRKHVGKPISVIPIRKKMLFMNMECMAKIINKEPTCLKGITETKTFFIQSHQGM